MHNAGYAALGLGFAYVAADVAPPDLAAALHGARALGFRGLSITIPHKVTAMAHVDEVDDIARGIGCINTIVNRNGTLYGSNSDGLGALNALSQAEASPRGKRVLMLGSGGAARAIAVTLAREAPPKQLQILGIVPDELERLTADVASIGSTKVAGAALTAQSLEQAMADSEILLHCSPVGMAPSSDESLVPPQLLRPGLVVFDVVYTPRTTRLLGDAVAAGCRVVEGIEMFLGQAFFQFELFTGTPAPTAVMRQALLEAL